MTIRARRFEPATVERSRELRRDMTLAEKKLWARLRRTAIHGARFRRQVPIGPYFADFCCLEQKLIIELDGGQHEQRKQYDERRTSYLESRGFRVLRFWNGEVFHRLDAVLGVITQHWSPHPSLPPQIVWGKELGDCRPARARRSR